MDKTKGHTRIQTTSQSRSQSQSQSQTPARHGVVKQGILWQQSDKLFSKWKERYFILTRDHLCCLKKGEGGFTCGETVSKIRLDDIKSIEFATRITHQTIELTLGGENQGNRILLKSNGDLREWFDVLNACCNIAKQRKNPQSGYIEAVKARGRNLRREKTEIRQTDGMRFINLSDHLPRFSFRGVSNSLQKPRPRSNSASPYGPLADLESATPNGFALRTPGGSLRSKLRNYDKIYRTRNDTTTAKSDEGQELSENVCYRISRPQSSIPSPPPRNH